jgi:hypothetical protein
MITFNCKDGPVSVPVAKIRELAQGGMRQLDIWRAMELDGKVKKMAFFKAMHRRELNKLSPHQKYTDAYLFKRILDTSSPTQLYKRYKIPPSLPYTRFGVHSWADMQKLARKRILPRTPGK